MAGSEDRARTGSSAPRSLPLPISDATGCRLCSQARVARPSSLSCGFPHWNRIHKSGHCPNHQPRRSSAIIPKLGTGSRMHLCGHPEHRGRLCASNGQTPCFAVTSWN
jgi:hypothetical protein